MFEKKCCHCETSAHAGRGNPPVPWNQVTITTKNRNVSHSSGHFSVHFPSNRGIATPLKRTYFAMTAFFMAMTGNLGRIPTNTSSPRSTALPRRPRLYSSRKYESIQQVRKLPAQQTASLPVADQIRQKPPQLLPCSHPALQLCRQQGATTEEALWKEEKSLF